MRDTNVQSCWCGRKLRTRSHSGPLGMGLALVPALMFSLVLGLLLVGAGACQARDVKIAVYPSNDPAKLARAMDILAKYLSGETGDSVTAVITRDYKELADRLREKSVDIAWINTLNYVRVKSELPDIGYIATYMEKNEHTGKIKPFYQAYILATKLSRIADLEGAKGKRFSFTDKGSTSGYAYPNLLLKKRGMVPDLYFSKVFFLKKHDRVIQALLAGSIDVGAVSDGTYFTAVREYGDRFTILAESDPIPLDAIVASEAFPADKVAQYRTALTAMAGTHDFCKTMREELGWSAAGFQVRGDSFYDTVRQALEN